MRITEVFVTIRRRKRGVSLLFRAVNLSFISALFLRNWLPSGQKRALPRGKAGAVARGRRHATAGLAVVQRSPSNAPIRLGARNTRA